MVVIAADAPALALMSAPLLAGAGGGGGDGGGGGGSNRSHARHSGAASPLTPSASLNCVLGAHLGLKLVRARAEA